MNICRPIYIPLDGWESRISHSYAHCVTQCAWEWEMRDSHPSSGTPMGMGNKLLKLMGVGREWELLRTLIINVFSFNHYFPSKICI